MVSVDDYTEIRECDYKEEHYSVRDNGAVLRHPKEGKRKRRLDNVWSFGKVNAETNYLYFSSQPIHRIIATAFHGPAPADNYVVDHIDTNRQNNQPENLRWLTRLDNILLNDITRNKIIGICGSIENFLRNPSLLYAYSSQDKNFAWMRRVTKEEAENCMANWKSWLKNETIKRERYNKERAPIGEWIYRKPSYSQRGQKPSEGYKLKEHERREVLLDDTYTEDEYEEPIPAATPAEPKELPEPTPTQSLTPNAIQLDWKHPVEFLCCPQHITDKPLETYMANLAEGKVFSRNNLGESTILKYGMTNPETLWVMCKINIGFKTHAITKITFKDNIFYHKNIGVYDIGDEPEELFDSFLKS